MKRLLVAALFALASSMAFAQTLPLPNFRGLEINGTAQTFPASGSIAGTTDTQTLTNKTISGSSNTLSNIAESALSAIAADSLLGNPTAGSAAPGVVNLTSCSTTSSALTYSTSSHAFGCNTIVGSAAGYATVAALVAANVPASVQTITTAGYYSAGDGGGTTYARVASAPANSCNQQSADGAFWTPISTTPFNVLACGAKGDGSNNDGPPIASAMANCGAFGGGTVLLPQTSVGVYLTAQSILPASGCVIEGTGGGAVGTAPNSVTLRAGGGYPANTPLVDVMGGTRSGATNLVIDCHNATGCTEIRYASQNHPIATHAIFEHLTLENGSTAFVCGLTPSALPITAATVTGSGPYTVTYTTSGTVPWTVGSTYTIGAVANVTPSTLDFTNGSVTAISSTQFTHQFASDPGTYTSGGYALDGDEADQATISDVIQSGNGTNTNAIGFNIASENCMQQTKIENVFSQLLHYWLIGTASNGTVQFDRWTGGSFVGNGGYAFLFNQFWGGPYIITNSETEGATGSGAGQIAYAVNDNSRTSSIGSSGVSILSGNNFNAGVTSINGNGAKYLLEGNALTGTTTMGTSIYCSQANYATFSGGTAGC